MGKVRTPADDPVNNSLRPTRALVVEGFKSIGAERTIEVRPLTILAGANSSGKSSILQPLLLLKQTLEAPYDPGAPLLNGPNVKFTAVSQLLCRQQGSNATFAFGIAGDHSLCKLHFRKGTIEPVELERVTIDADGVVKTFAPE